MVQSRERFEQIFGDSTEKLRSFFAPGRVNLIGEHTDFTGGYVLPASVKYGTFALVRARKDGRFRLASTTFDELIEFDGDKITQHPTAVWGNYPKGMIRELSKSGIRFSGYDILFAGNLPQGAGLSSSASIELVTGVALATMENLNLSILDLVKMALWAENDFVGVQCGIMDQFAVGMGKQGHALLLKCDTLNYRYIPLALGDYVFVITNSNKRRNLTESKYNARRHECEEGFAIVRQQLPTITCLGDLAINEWKGVQKYIQDPEIKKRLDHVVSENARTLASTQALESGDLTTFGHLMLDSHKSLRDLYEVTGRELDALFDAAMRVQGCLGTRMIGAGFGGCTLSLVHRTAVQEFKVQISAEYQGKTGLKPEFYRCDIGAGAREVTTEVE